jgi:hypothetical protein
LGEDCSNAVAAVYCRGVRRDKATIVCKERHGPIELGGAERPGEGAGYLVGAIHKATTLEALRK